MKMGKNGEMGEKFSPCTVLLGKSFVGNCHKVNSPK